MVGPVRGADLTGRNLISVSDTPSPRPSLPRQLIESHKGEWKAMIVSLVCSIAQVALTMGNVSVVRSVIDHASRSAWRAVGVAATVFGLAVGAVVAQEASRSVGIAAGERAL